MLFVMLALILMSCQPAKDEVSIAFTSPSVALPFLVLSPEEARVRWNIQLVDPDVRLRLMQQRTVDLVESDFFELYSLALEQRMYETPLKGLALLHSDHSLIVNVASVNKAVDNKVLGMVNLSASDYLLEHWFGTALVDRRHVGSEAMSRKLLHEGVLDGAVLSVHERLAFLQAGFVKQKSLLSEEAWLGVLVLVNQDMSAKLIADVLHDYQLGVEKLRKGEDLSYVLDPYRERYDVEYSPNYPQELFFPPSLFEELSQWIVLRFPFTERLNYEEMFMVESPS
jgi:hypothetical protein